LTTRFPTTLSRALALASSAVVLASCGADEEPEQTGEEPLPAPSASEFPEPGESLGELLARVGETNEVVAAPSGGVFVPGQSRFGFGLFDVAGPQIDDADVAVYAAEGASGKPQGPFPARVEDLSTQPAYTAESADEETDATSVYVSDIPLDEPGEWRMVAVIREPSGEMSATYFTTSVEVTEYPDIPAPGQQAPEVSTPTLDEVGDPTEIDTRVPPSTMHGDDLADVLGKQPVVLLFATPALCQTRVCGPVVDVAEQVKAEYGDEAAFIHMEIYEDNVFDLENLRPQVKAYGLPSEPWLFVIDKEGEVKTRIEGAFSVEELEDALEPLVG